MSKHLDVIALISGGKDSFYSMLHCMQHGHQIIALGNLHPPSPAGFAPKTPDKDPDLNSMMYQTVGHTVIPLYEDALKIPLYRRAITGTAVNSDLSYHPSQEDLSTHDETEDLFKLLQDIKRAHPSASAVSTGAILSNYQRTRVESVAIRLGLTPLSYLWQYPSLSPCIPWSLLLHMEDVGLEARIVKVASGGLDETFLWNNITNAKDMTRMAYAVAKFGNTDDGAVLGEGGEFETLVLDGPHELFDGRIVIDAEDALPVKEDGGSWYLRFRKARVVRKQVSGPQRTITAHEPCIFDPEFAAVLQALSSSGHMFRSRVYDLSITGREQQQRKEEMDAPTASGLEQSGNNTTHGSATILGRHSCPRTNASVTTGLNWSIVATKDFSNIAEEAQDIISQIRVALRERGLKPSDIVFVTILLNHMRHFETINAVYGQLFTQPNPPARVTVDCGKALSYPIIIHLKLRPAFGPTDPMSRALHVQSISYWAPANIGPYAQAHSLPLSDGTTSKECYIAGQIPLVPSKMVEMTPSHFMDAARKIEPPFRGNCDIFGSSAVLALQHLHRIAVEMNVQYFIGAIAYIPDFPAQDEDHLRILDACTVWRKAYTRPAKPADEEDAEDDERDLWEEQNNASRGQQRSKKQEQKASIPDWNNIKSPDEYTPPMFVAVVQALPRNARIEWQSILGVSGPNIEVKHVHEGRLTLHICELEKTAYIIAAVHNNWPIELLDPTHFWAHIHMSETIDTYSKTRSVQPSTAWINTGLKEIRGNVESALASVPTIPCHWLTDAKGVHLMAVILFRVEPKETA